MNKLSLFKRLLFSVMVFSINSETIYPGGSSEKFLTEEVNKKNVPYQKQKLPKSWYSKMTKSKNLLLIGTSIVSLVSLIGMSYLLVNRKPTKDDLIELYRGMPIKEKVDLLNTFQNGTIWENGLYKAASESAPKSNL